MILLMKHKAISVFGLFEPATNLCYATDLSMIRGETVGTHIRELIWRCRARSFQEVEGLSRPTSSPW
jgi:hypothetical protein